MESMLAERVVSLSWRLKRTETIQNQAIDALDERTKNNPLAQLANSFLPKHLQPPKKDPTVPELDLTLGRLVIKDFSNSRVLDRLLMSKSAFIHPTACISSDVSLSGVWNIGRGCILGSGTALRDSVMLEGSTLERGSLQESIIPWFCTSQNGETV